MKIGRKKIHKRIFSEGLVLAVTSYCISKFINEPVKKTL